MTNYCVRYYSCLSLLNNGSMDLPITPLSFATSKLRSSPDVLNYPNAMSSSDASGFWAAMKLEIDTLYAMNNWTPVSKSTDLASNHIIIPGTWTFKCKQYPDGSVRKLKARYCLHGDRLQQVVAWSTVRLLLNLSLAFNLQSCQVDYNNAFAQATMPELKPQCPMTSLSISPEASTFRITR